ncbi:hypothetical protein BRYFOR_05120 [Marvinbryantia formatexigens DSM 14469]|uniref:NlpC/P60 domain-containing protein n=1 Tax=Marvinbryantia formatexigens DSM 14469 TaxID=478749 RepID=C6L930_9FIRM|nr:hypothetical protein [Marvinbryantia formatexigens]EET62769.1 hypothetical protein BRYFOR_05120 [Marvinbryantia formatexigens DSM 14469]UWO23129.1 hypothetical protein NQ534_11710 [Marvinbryantia formatexigens DSM 14469]SDG00520.1 hypothetical protein SAMN05660368_01743 [Marvinbryantia formatexigens]
MPHFSQTTKAGTLHNPQLPALKFFLQIALQPVGSTMYVWGGGWNESDTGAGREACTIGVSPRWKTFASQQTASYDYRTTRYQIHDGLDCSGYVGWCIYNLMHMPLSNYNQHFMLSHPESTDTAQRCIHVQNTSTPSVRGATPYGYVMPAHHMAANFAARGWGTFIPRNQIVNYRAGDIMSSPDHVWIAIGECSDGSVVLLHSSPPGVRLCGTPRPARVSAICSTPGISYSPVHSSHTPTAASTRSGNCTSSAAPVDSQAVRLASHYMRTYYPDWYSRYPDCSCDSSYLCDYDQMRWDTSGKAALTDPDGFQKMSASAILKDLLSLP